MKIIPILASMMLAASVVVSCGNHSDHDDHNHSNHDGHNHEAEAHNHEAEDHDEHDHDHDHEGEGADAHDPRMANAIVFTDAKVAVSDFALDTCQLVSFGAVIKTVAQVLPAQGSQRVVVAKSSGVVVMAGNDITEGKEVRSGQPLFRIESSGLADNSAEVKYAEVQNEYTRAKAEYERKSQLAADRIVSKSDLLAAQTAYENARAAYQNLSKSMSHGAQSVAAPIAGYITQLQVRSGDFVEMGQPLLTIAQNQYLYLQAEVSPRYAQALTQISGANFRMLNQPEVYTLGELNGRVVSAGQSATTDNPLLPVVFRIDNKAGFVPGCFVQTYIQTTQSTPVLTVPNTALVEEMGRYFVFRRIAHEHYEKCLVTLGATDGLRTQITSGIQAGDVIVGRGAMLVKLSQSAGALDPHSGHAH